MAALAVAAGVGWRVVGLREVLFLCVLCAAAVLAGLAGAWLTVLLARPSVRLSVPVPTPSVGETVVVAAQVTHALPHALPVLAQWRVDGVPVGHVPVRADVTAGAGPHVRAGVLGGAGRRRGARPRDGRGDGGDAGAAVGGAVGGGGWAQFPLSLVARGRGRARVELARMWVEDPLGLARCRARAHAGADVLVLPARLAPGSLPEGLGGVGTEGSRPGSGEPGGNLRDYRRSDPPRRVHWKQSARQGRLMVNIPESGSGVLHVLALVTDPAAYPGPRRAEQFEQAVSVVATLVVQWLGRGEAVDAQVVGVTGVPTPLPTRSVDAVLCALAEVGLDSSGGGGGEGRGGGGGDGRGDGRGRGGGGDGGAHPGMTAPTAVPEAARAGEGARAASAPSPDIVVAGAPTPALRAVLGGRGGVLVATGPVDEGGAASSALPTGWQLVAVPPGRPGEGWRTGRAGGTLPTAAVGGGRHG